MRWTTSKVGCLHRYLKQAKIHNQRQICLFIWYRSFSKNIQIHTRSSAPLYLIYRRFKRLKKRQKEWGLSCAQSLAHVSANNNTLRLLVKNRLCSSWNAMKNWEVPRAPPDWQLLREVGVGQVFISKEKASLRKVCRDYQSRGNIRLHSLRQVSSPTKSSQLSMISTLLTFYQAKTPG